MLRNHLILLLSAAALTACGAGLSKTTPKGLAGFDLVSANGGGTANEIVGYAPVSGSYTSVPATVQITFNTSSLDAAGASAVSTYSISCGGNPLAAQSVTFTPGLNSVSVALPSITGLADGTLCTFSVSISLKDASGNFVVGEHTINYTISSTGSTVQGGTWDEAATVSYTSAVGSPAGAAFMGHGAAGTVVSGLLLNGGTYVNGLAGLWSNGFTNSSPSAGPVQGASNGGFTQLACPAGYRLTGIYGRSGSYIDAIGIVCKTQDQSQTYTSQTFGGSGGNAFTLSCPAGQFVTDLDGMSDGYLEQLYLGCR